MKELTADEIVCINGGNPVFVIAAYVAVRYVAARIGAGVATGVVVGITEAYLES